MQYVARVIPPSYIFQNIHGVISGRAVTWDTLTLGAALAVLYVIAASWLFYRMYRRGVRTGLIARYSAETVS